MTARIATLCLAGALCMGGVAQADTLLIDSVDEAQAEQVARPSRGMSMKRVQDRFGAPVRAQPAVGDPPITTWEYSDFLVYFEFDRVIHAVDKSAGYNRS
jgi:hypothetical protein